MPSAPSPGIPGGGAPPDPAVVARRQLGLALGGQQGGSVRAEAAGPAAATPPPGPPRCALQTRAAAAVLSTCGEAIFTAFSCRSWPARLSPCCGTHSPARGSLGPLHFEGAAGGGGPVASEWMSRGLHAASREAAGPQLAFLLRDEVIFFSFHPAQDVAQSCPLTLVRFAVWTGVSQGGGGRATWRCGGPDFKKGHWRLSLPHFLPLF